jgi:hypothetical protein
MEEPVRVQKKDFDSALLKLIRTPAAQAAEKVKTAKSAPKLKARTTEQSQ